MSALCLACFECQNSQSYSKSKLSQHVLICWNVEMLKCWKIYLLCPGPLDLAGVIPTRSIVRPSVRQGGCAYYKKDTTIWKSTRRKFQTLKCWNVETLKCWNVEMLKCWNVEMLIYWNIDKLSYWKSRLSSMLRVCKDLACENWFE